jgi:hypothetical protein
VPPARYQAPGRFTVAGTVAEGGDGGGDGGPTATATVRVTGDVRRGENLAAAAGPAHPVADASFSGAPDTLPAAMLDGVAGTGWSNAYRKEATVLLPAFDTARRSDWVSVRWPNPQRFGTVTASFTVGDGHRPPAAIAVTYRDGEDLVPVRGLSVGWAGAVATLSFEPVGTTEVRLALTAAAPGAAGGFLGIDRLAVTGDAVAYRAVAALTRLWVGDRPVPRFASSTMDYQVAVGDVGTPEIAADAADNGRLLIVPPPAVPGTGVVVVTAEDGLARRTYTVHLVTAPPARPAPPHLPAPPG